MSDSHTDGAIRSRLYHEHLILGAEFGDNGHVLRYHPQESEHASNAWHEGVLLAEVTAHYLLLASGDASPQFAEAACAGKKLAVGACAFEGVLTGDGSLVSIPLLARTGDHEYLFFDRSPRIDVLDAWLSFLSTIEQNGVSPFAGIRCEEVADTHVAFLLWGKRSTELLSDYLHDGEHLPRKGEVRACMLDEIPCIVMRPEVARHDAYLLLVPPHKSVILWRSMLSFTYATPVGNKTVNEMLDRGTTWWKLVSQDGAIRVSKDALESMHLVRAQPDYVGARGLEGATGRGV